MTSRVLWVGDHFGYAGGVAHGVTSYYLNVLPALKAEGLQVWACFLREAHPLARQLIDAGVEVRFLASSKWSPWVFPQVVSIARRFRPEIVHTVGMKACIAGRLAAQVTKARNLIHVHDLERPPKPIRWLYRPLASPSDAGLGVSSAVTRYAPDVYRLRPERTVTLHNGIGLERFRAPQDVTANRQRLLQLGPECPIVGVIGRFHAVKGHTEMLDIFKRVVQMLPAARLVLVGDGPLRETCERKARECGLERQVVFLGQRSDIPELVSCFDLLAIPSRSEGLPIAAIEAMAAARPVVSFGVGGVADIVQHGRTGIVIPPGDKERFAAEVVALLNDPDRRSGFGRRAVEVSQAFALPEHVRRLLDYYETLRDARFLHGPLPGS